MQTIPVKEPTNTRRRTRFAWYAYDLGNSTVEFAIPLYLTIWIVQDLGVAAWILGLVTATSSWAIGLSGPYIGVRADERHERRHWYMGSVLSSFVLLGLISFLPHRGTPALVSILVVSIVATYLFQLSALIYNASMLTAARGANVVSVSAMGIGLSYLGGLLGIAVIETLVSGHLIPGVSGRGYAALPAALIFLACSIPSFYAKDLWQKASDVVEIPEGSLHRRMYTLWQDSSRQYRAGWFLAGYFALNSAIMGLTMFLPLHVQAIIAMSHTTLALIFGIVVIASTVGAGVVSLLHPVGKTVWRILVLGLALLGVNAVVLSLMRSEPLVIMCGCFHGMLSGALVPTARAAFAQTFRSDYQALAFGLYGAVQRVSQGLGAAIFPIASAAGGTKATSAGIAAMGVLALAGVPLMARWRFPAVQPSTASPSSSPGHTRA